MFVMVLAAAPNFAPVMPSVFMLLFTSCATPRQMVWVPRVATKGGSLKFATIGKDDADRLRALCDRYPVAWLRDPFGHRWRAHVKPSWSHGVGQLWPVGIDWDAVRWTEAWDG